MPTKPFSGFSILSSSLPLFKILFTITFSHKDGLVEAAPRFFCGGVFF